jgi:hypothetical protein
MQDDFWYLCFESFPIGIKNIWFGQSLPFAFFLKHLKSCSLGQFSPFLCKREMDMEIWP